MDLICGCPIKFATRPDRIKLPSLVAGTRLNEVTPYGVTVKQVIMQVYFCIAFSVFQARPGLLQLLEASQNAFQATTLFETGSFCYMVYRSDCPGCSDCAAELAVCFLWCGRRNEPVNAGPYVSGYYQEQTSTCTGGFSFLPFVRKSPDIRVLWNFSQISTGLKSWLRVLPKANDRCTVNVNKCKACAGELPETSPRQAVGIRVSPVVRLYPGTGSTCLFGQFQNGTEVSYHISPISLLLMCEFVLP